MYQRYWHLETPPFENSLDAGFFFPSGTHQGALLKLQYAVETRKELALLTGGHGTGKTYLTHVLEHDLGPDAGPFVRVIFPQMSPAEMLSYIAVRIGCPEIEVHSDRGGVDRTLRVVEGRLQQLSESGVRLVLVIDDAHLLSPEHLQTLQLFLNIQQHAGDACLVILTGRPDLLPHVQRVGGLYQRVSVRMALHGLSEDEVGRYVDHRLARAGSEGVIFEEASIRILWELSQGSPRRLNQICDLALLVGYADSLSAITPVELEAAAQELTSVSCD